MNVILSQAEKIISVAKEKSIELNTNMNIAIVDAEGIVIGAIGVSGSSVENDHAVAEAGATVI